MPANRHAEVVHARLMVGLEIHIELATRSKMFTRVTSPGHPDAYDREPNALVDPVVAALPGTLPVMNRRAVEMSMQVGLALGCTVARRSKWDRKNYYYPDLPKGYQISQYDEPLCHDGRFALPLPDGSVRDIGIIRAHLEEDTGKLGHELPGGFRYEGSLVDLNRAGTPLLEVVTAPDFTSAAEVVAFAQELRSLCRFLGVTEGVMQKGHMRFEPNINVHIESPEGRLHKTPISEIKNLNSFKAVHGA
ncbi:MAG: Aspartyl/glutamyl-tRNA(Asn/Gln) amidotransferase subunit, partial [Planctomycetota bacterium]